MIWRRALRTDIASVGAFLAEYEPYNVSLSSRLKGKRKIILPPENEAALFLAQESDREHGDGTRLPLALALLTGRGSLFPLFSPQRLFSPEDIAPLIERIVPSHRRIFSILGPAGNVQLCSHSLDRPVDTALSYYLMRREKEIPLPDEKLPKPFRFQRLSVKNYESVFPLEERYQHEEVLIHPERFNRRAHLLYFKQTAAKQRIFFIEGPDGPVAKAGTNAIGLAYCQIGGGYTDPAYRRRHLSRILMTHLLNRCRDWGYSSVLFVRDRNTAALELYRGLSFDLITDYRIVYIQQ